MTTAGPAGARLDAQTFPYGRYRTAGRWLGRTWRSPAMRALTKAVLTIWITTTLTFGLIRLMPGSPVDIKIEELTRDGAMTYEEARGMVGALIAIDLDAPVHEQYLSFLEHLARGDLGASFLSSGTSVSSIILAVLPWTILAVGVGTFLSFIVGVLIGLVAAYRRGGWFDNLFVTGSSIVSSIQPYLLAVMIIVVFGVQLRWLPVAQMRGATTPGIAPGFTLEFIGDVLYHASLPILMFFLVHIGHWVLSMKSATLGSLEEDYVAAARARGLSDARITTAYVGRNAILPLVQQLAIAAGFIVGGSILIETLLVYPGVGYRLDRAIAQRDYPVMQGILLVITASVVVANLVADLVYSKIDPRIGRPGGASG
ncbi:MAG TPA: ABC transporter permease [Candidatus Limnocylindria bacterium]|nr:ABC transporter permease [Candidatus Limnocylindria bacterium]